MSIADTPETPYYAVIFTSIRTSQNNGYEEMAAKMVSLAKQQPGFLGVESSREQIGITVSYWQDLQSIAAWKQQMDHQAAQQLGKQQWYSSYKTRIALVEKDYEFTTEDYSP